MTTNDEKGGAAPAQDGATENVGPMPPELLAATVPVVTGDQEGVHELPGIEQLQGGPVVEYGGLGVVEEVTSAAGPVVDAGPPIHCWYIDVYDADKATPEDMAILLGQVQAAVERAAETYPGKVLNIRVRARHPASENVEPTPAQVGRADARARAVAALLAAANELEEHDGAHVDHRPAKLAEECRQAARGIARGIA